MTEYQGKITQEELQKIFGDNIPIDAVTLLHVNPDQLSHDQIREKLKTISQRPQGMSASSFFAFEILWRHGPSRFAPSLSNRLNDLKSKELVEYYSGLWFLTGKGVMLASGYFTEGANFKTSWDFNVPNAAFHAQ
jgi:hypothetical protein